MVGTPERRKEYEGKEEYNSKWLWVRMRDEG
jgi:hypothetical protein